MYEYNAFGNGPESSTLSEHVKKSPQPLASTAGQHPEGGTAEEASDSGDSLFITQKPVPDVVRSARRRRREKRSSLAYCRYLEDSETDSSASSSSQEEPRTGKGSNRAKSCLPKYTFAFLPGNKPKDTALPAQKNRVLHTFAVAGFFKCISEFAAKTSLPTVDTDDEDISPLSEEEEEEEKSHICGFRIVDKKCFATALKATSCQTGRNQRNRQKTAGCVGETSFPGRQLEIRGETPAEASTSMERRLSCHSERSNHAVPLSNFLRETTEVDKLTPIDAPNPKLCLTLGAKETCRDDNRDTAACEPADVDGGWEVHSQSQTGETVDTLGHQTLLHTTPSSNSNERICTNTRVKKRKRKKKKGQARVSVEGQRQEEPESLLGSVTLEEETRGQQTAEEIVSHERGLHDEKTDRKKRTSRKHRNRKGKKSKAANFIREGYLESDVMITESRNSLGGGGKKQNNEDDVSQSERRSTANGNFNGAEGVKVNRKKNKKGTRVITADIHEESHNVTGRLEGSGNESQNGSTLETVEGLIHSQRQKSTKKRQPSSSDAPRAEGVVDGHGSNIAAALRGRMGKSHKRKRKRIWDEDEISRALEDNMPNLEGFAGDRSAKAVKKHKTKVDPSEDTVARNNCSVAVQKKGRTTSSFLCADAVEKDAQIPREHISFRAEVLDTPSAEIITNLEHSDHRVKKRKRKRKQRCRDALDKGVDRKKDSEGRGNGLVTMERMENAAVLRPLQNKSKEDSSCMAGDPSHVGTLDGCFKQASYAQPPKKQALKDNNSETEMNSCADVPRQGELLTDSAQSGFRKRKKERTAAPLTSDMSPSVPEISSSVYVGRKKPQILKRKLYNPMEDFFE